MKRTIYLKRWLREINTLGWTRDPRRPGARMCPVYRYFDPGTLRVRLRL